MNGGEEAASGGGHVEGRGRSVGFCEPGPARILISSISTVDGGTGVIFRGVYLYPTVTIASAKSTVRVDFLDGPHGPWEKW